jgi:integrase/recombinase XerD
MLEHYFVKPDTLDRLRASWIGEPIEQYVTWLHEHGYAARNVFRRVPLLWQFGEFARAQGATHWEELPQYVEAFSQVWAQKHGPHSIGLSGNQKSLDWQGQLDA